MTAFFLRNISLDLVEPIFVDLTNFLRSAFEYRTFEQTAEIMVIA